MLESTIVGIATAIGEGGISIIRISGSDAISLFEQVFVTKGYATPYESHKLMYGHIYDEETLIDEAMGVVMYAPKSYTMEDVCEIHVHGGTLVTQLTMQCLLQRGASIAMPGEFTKRAFMNGRIDLSEAEAVMGIIHAQSTAALQVAQLQLSGGQSHYIHDLQNKLIALLAGMEAHIDYPDEIDEEEALDGLQRGLSSIILSLQSSISKRNARLVSEGLRLALCGTPNAGKSTLFNALLGEEKAIVTNIPGTTRDVLSGTFMLDGIAIQVFDTAGLRNSSDVVEQIGVHKAQETLSTADVALILIDGSTPLETNEKDLLRHPPTCPFAVLLTKGDAIQAVTENDLRTQGYTGEILSISAHTGMGLDNIHAYIRPYITLPQQTMLTQARHMEVASEVLTHLQHANCLIEQNSPLELATVDLHEALYLLGRITGESVDEKLLDDIFSRFCVGK